MSTPFNPESRAILGMFLLFGERFRAQKPSPEAVFNDAQRNSLQAVLGQSYARALPGLACVASFGQDSTISDSITAFLGDAALSKATKAAERLSTALRHCLQAARDYEQWHSLCSFIGAAGNDPAEDDSIWPGSLTLELLRSTAILDGYRTLLKQNKKRGWKDWTQREVFGVFTALVLQEAEVPVRKYIDGHLARTLPVIYEAAGLELPSAIYSDVARIVDTVRWLRTEAPSGAAPEPSAP